MLRALRRIPQSGSRLPSSEHFPMDGAHDNRHQVNLLRLDRRPKGVGTENARDLPTTFVIMHPHEVLRLSAGGLAVVLVAVAVLGRRRSSRQRTRAVLGAGLIALTTPLVIWAGLLLRHEVQLHSLDPRSSGAVPGGTVKIAALALRSDRYWAPEQRRAFFHRVMARLNDVPGIRVDDSGTALPLAGKAYFALFFSIGDGSPDGQLPDGQRFIRWQADIGPDRLAEEINHAVKTVDRGIHYWHVGSDVPRGTFVVFAAYAAVALLLAYIGFRGEALDRGMAAAAAGIAIGLGLAAATTWLLTGYLWGVSERDLTTFLVSATTVAGIVLIASRVRHSALPGPAVHPVDARDGQTGW